MKRSFLSTLSTFSVVALSTTILLSSNLPVIGQLAVPAVAQSSQQQQAIKLVLSQSKKVPTKNGFKLVPISNSTSVKPGDVIVYSVTANNVSDRTIRKLNINQKILPGTVYEGQSATPISGADLTFSVDGGENFAAKPLINKKPAAASAYTNVRWVFATVPPKSKSTVSYAVVVR
jgi:uncharacterized repeat protein (TIGR01451 family)